MEYDSVGSGIAASYHIQAAGLGLRQKSGKNKKLTVPAHLPTESLACHKTKNTPVDGEKVCVAVQKARAVLQTKIESRVFSKDKKSSK